ncbi:phosphoenolpyruvate--protein phosphotransferase [Lyngbya sp. CCY1209]|uniref:phosphoenolpyruvate--protein phosphotransferase n=1 Tax=Lyngbya sp. CCY1209 TaxID=2886103 RepID=UPI002D20993A|nr:phosphoenolpyruvate--protein phosphotransferase [Lyngbya sp. CCY1209]MEB3882848.1 phosphoenolpyruvate--protein phosphotransferase [Lyngbya sp. CCY1209]
MVGIAIVSHSHTLAVGIRELAAQMAGDAVPIAIVADLGGPDTPLEVDAVKIYQAIAPIESDGVVVFADLGRAVAAAKRALELFPAARRCQIRLCAAPLAEGAIAAAVTAAGGAELDRVVAEAENAMTSKLAQLGAHDPPDSPPPEHFPTGQLHLTLDHSTGLHARPAAQLVKLAFQFESDITLENITARTAPVNAKSINQVIALGVRDGEEIAIAATGADAAAALEALRHLLTEELTSPNRSRVPQRLSSPPPDRSLRGIPAAGGIAIGPVMRCEPAAIHIETQHTEHPQREWEFLQRARDSSRAQMLDLHREIGQRCAVTDRVGSSEAAIFATHLLHLDDPTLMERARELIWEQHHTAAAAWKTAIEEVVATYEHLEDPLLRSRSADVWDVGRRVLQLLTGAEPVCLLLREPGILVAPELTPSEIAQLDPERVLGICTAAGCSISHSGILGRSLGIPMVVGVGPELLHLSGGTAIAIDGGTGQVWVDPHPDQIEELRRRRERQLATARDLRQAAQNPAVAADGHRLRVMANISGVAEARIAMQNGAEGVGILRSEFLFLARRRIPSEDEQVELYRAIANAIDPHPLGVRILDIGGDKPMPGISLPDEDNPFLGWRGIRLLLDRPDLLRAQLRALLRVGCDRPVKILFPMVARLQEIRAARDILTEEWENLRRQNVPLSEMPEVGAMVEVPAAALMAERLAAAVDFFSIGTNDLTQYAMAADRTNSKVAALTDALEPAVLRLVAETIAAAKRAGIWASVCGELAADPVAVPIWMGLGAHELSLNPQAIPMVKMTISRIRRDEAEAIAREALQLESAIAVRELVRSRLGLTINNC